MGSARLERAGPWVFRGAFAASLGLVVVLASSHRALRERFDTYVEATTEPRVGLPVPMVRVGMLGGDSVTLGDGRIQVVFFYNTTCPYCQASVPFWNRIAGEAARAGVEVYGVQLDSAELAPGYVARFGVRFPVVFTPDSRVARFYRVTGVPLTVVLDREARIGFVRRGEVSAEVVVDSVLAAIAAAVNDS